MNTILNILTISTAVMALLIVLAKYFEAKNAHKKTKQVIEDFLTSVEPGEFCLDLIYEGYLQTLKVKNHSKEFPDKNHLAKFIKYSTEDIKNSIKRISETYEKFVL